MAKDDDDQTPTPTQAENDAAKIASLGTSRPVADDDEADDNDDDEAAVKPRRGRPPKAVVEARESELGKDEQDEADAVHRSVPLGNYKNR